VDLPHRGIRGFDKDGKLDFERFKEYVYNSGITIDRAKESNEIFG